MNIKKVIIIIVLIFAFVGITALAYLYFSGSEKVAILTYHDVVDEIDSDDINTVNISTKKFEKQIKWLSENGYKTLTMDEFYDWKVNNKKIANKSILITFDDGWESYYTKAIPILEKYNMKSAVFVIFLNSEHSTERNDHFYMTFDQIDDVIKNHPNMEILSHSYNLHDRQYTESEDYNTYYQDIIKVAEIHPGIKYYAYPFGRRNNAYIEALSDNDYRLAFTFGPYDFAKRDSDNYQVPRLGISELLPDWKFKLKMLFKI